MERRRYVIFMTQNECENDATTPDFLITVVESHIPGLLSAIYTVQINISVMALLGSFTGNVTFLLF